MSKRRQVLLKVIEDLVTTLRQRIGLHKSEYIHGKIKANNQNNNNNTFQSERSWSRLTKDREPFKNSEIEQNTGHPENLENRPKISPKSSVFSSNGTGVCVARYDHSSKSWKAELSRVAQAADKLFDLLDLTTTASSHTLNSAVSERTNSTVTPPQFEYDPESVCEKSGGFQNQEEFQNQSEFQNPGEFHRNRVGQFHQNPSSNYQNTGILNSMHSHQNSMQSQHIGQIIHSRQQSTASTQLSLGKAISRDQILNSSIASSSITDSYRRMSQSSTATGISTVHSHAEFKKKRSKNSFFSLETALKKSPLKKRP